MNISLSNIFHDLKTGQEDTQCYGNIVISSHELVPLVHRRRESVMTAKKISTQRINSWDIVAFCARGKISPSIQNSSSLRGRVHMTDFRYYCSFLCNDYCMLKFQNLGCWLLPRYRKFIHSGRRSSLVMCCERSERGLSFMHTGTFSLQRVVSAGGCCHLVNGREWYRE